mgnify:CR=1 FL=1
MDFLARRLHGRGQHQEAERLQRECVCKRGGLSQASHGEPTSGSFSCAKFGDIAGYLGGSLCTFVLDLGPRPCVLPLSAFLLGHWTPETPACACCAPVNSLTPQDASFNLKSSPGCSVPQAAPCWETGIPTP